MKRDRPLLIYDGDCRFCRLWIERWKSITGDRVEYRSSQEVAQEFPEVPLQVFEGSVQFVDKDGQRHERGAAVFRSLATATLSGQALATLHAHIPIFAAICDSAYGVVARYRTFFSRLTRLLWGHEMRLPTYALANLIFLRVLGLIYLIAFISFGQQARGLVGTHGILPVNAIFPQAARALGSDAWWQWPTLLWLRPEEGMLFALTWVGVVCSLLILAGMMQPLTLAVAWMTYLSLTVAGQEFYSFQWDILLLETGLLAIFAAPWYWRPNLVPRTPSRFAHFLLMWLLFRLMFSSGVVKLSSGDPTWANLTALDFHYWTQPLPNTISWFFAQAPEWFQKFSCFGMFAVELICPFFIFFPRRLRLIAFCGIAGLQLLIAFTGNYGFFNLLALVLALLLLDDAVLPRFRSDSHASIAWSHRILPPLGIAYLTLSLVPLVGVFRNIPPMIEPLVSVYRFVAPFRSINSYGLFAVMTTERPEIVLQGSMDGIIWEAYEFKYKPGSLNRPPPFVAPYMPRLDWQMWFAALGNIRQSPWMAQFVIRLFQAEPSVLGLLEHDPFHGKPPRFLRANLDEYRFTNFQQLRMTGNWWRSEPRGVYFPEIMRKLSD